MAYRIPILESADFDLDYQNAIQKSIELLTPMCVDGKVRTDTFKEIVDKAFLEFSLEAEDTDYEKVEIEINDLNCEVVESFVNLDFLKIFENA